MSQQLTHCSHDLSLNAILILKPACKIADSTTAVASNVRDSSNVVKHVSASEEKNHDQADTSPQVAVLQEGHNVWVCHRNKREYAQEYGY